VFWAKEWDQGLRNCGRCSL